MFGKGGAPGCMLCCRLHLHACDGAQVWLLFVQVREVWKCQSARPVRLPVQAVLFAELADFYYYFLCKRMSMSLL